ncbi:phenylacetate--CoA ligase family protein [Nocardia sp. NPDC005366]|uniref:phenylacetate--CoA ligase family protein n=1 Tax=Nocardia sp. NPDC005366 TaxID=3156878 RepID=UPI0033A7D105
MKQDDRYFEPDIELMSRTEIDALQEEKLLELVPYAYERSALYKKVWDEAGVHPRDIKTTQDFRERIPYITKDDIRDFRDATGDPFGGLLCVDATELDSISSSSGTTGDATFFAEQGKWRPLTTSFIRDMWEHGLRPGDNVLAAPMTFRGYGQDDMRQLGCVSVCVDTAPGADWTPVLEAIGEYDVRYIQLLGPAMAALERAAEKLDMRQALDPVKFVSFAGEPLGSRLQNRVRNDWDTRLTLWTSAGDTGTAWECQEHDGYHLWEDTVFPEVLDPADRTPAPEGHVGELVVTDIDNRTAPLIHYRAEDLVRYSTGVCGCGRSHRRIWPLGREGDLTVVSGKGVMPLEIWSAIEKLDETRSALFQIIRPQRELDELRIRVGYAPERTTDLTDLHDRLSTEISSATGVTPKLELVEEQAIISRASSAAKIPRIVKA